MTSPTIRLIPNLKGTDNAGLILESMLLIHKTIIESDAWNGYEGTPDQIEEIMYHCWGILSLLKDNISPITPDIILEKWIKDYEQLHQDQ
tara:strand:- start:160 stop:429 length:270 start_codon:yes stop_codon:yes gene_type:complete